MKKEELLKASKEELLEEKSKIMAEAGYCIWSDDCNICNNCEDCWGCKNCNNCEDCWGCTDQHGKRYMICDVQLTKEEYEAKIKELT